MRVAVIHDGGGPDWTRADVASVLDNAQDVLGILRAEGLEASLVPIVEGDLGWIPRVQAVDLVFNLCEGVNGRAEAEDHVTAILELTRVPYTGCRAWPITLCHRKHVANTLLTDAGVPVPGFALIRDGVLEREVPLPAIVKPAAEDASVGIDNGAVCTTAEALRARLAQAAVAWETVIVQEYVPGRELNVGFVGSRMLPISEISFARLPEGFWPIVTYNAKWAEGSPEDQGTTPVCPAPLDAPLTRRVADVARQAWSAMCGRAGYGRVDLRVDDRGEAQVLEVNPNPDLSRDAGLARMAAADGLSFEGLVLLVVEEALERFRSRAAAEALARKAEA